jgi:glutathione S-transferase
MAEPLVLYVVPASHPCVAVEAALRHKGLAYQRRDIMFGLSNPVQLRRFGSRTVPGLTVGRQRVSGSRLIMRALEGLRPEPSIVPSDPDLRVRVDEADEWGDFVFQEQVRWIGLQAVRERPDAFATFFEGYDLKRPPAALVRRFGPALILSEMKTLGHTPERVRDEYLPALPGHLDRIDALIAEGVIGQPDPNVADFQIAASVRLLLNFADLREGIEGRPCGQLARRLVPDYPGAVPAGALPSPLL